MLARRPTALLERAGGLYAELVDVNAYDQPGWDKHASSATVALQRRVRAELAATPSRKRRRRSRTPVGSRPVATVFELLEHLFRRAAPGRQRR